MILESSTEIEALPEEVFQFFEEIEERYLAWHPDHMTFEWVRGTELAEGNEAYFEERIGGDLQRRTIRYTTVEAPRSIEFTPTGRLTRLIIPKISFTIEPSNGGCRVTQRIRVRTGPIGRRLNREEFAAVRTHMDEEAANLKRIVESELSANEPSPVQDL